MDKKVTLFEDNEVTTTNAFNIRVGEINTALAGISDGTDGTDGAGAIPAIKRELAALTTVVTAQGAADAQHIADEVKHITAADRAAIAAKANAANAALTGITTMETAKLTGNLTLKNATNFGNKINFGDGEYVSVSEDPDDTLNLKGTHVKIFNGATEVLKASGGVLTYKGKELTSKSTSVAATLTAAGWVGTVAPFTQMLSVAAVTATSANEVLRPLALTEEIRETWDAASFADGGQSAGKLTVAAWGEKPTINLPCRIIVRGDL